jgi:hypothetical protein
MRIEPSGDGKEGLTFRLDACEMALRVGSYDEFYYKYVSDFNRSGF